MGWSRWMCHFWDHSDSVSFRWISASLREERWLVLGTCWCSWTTPSSRLLYACLSNDLLMLRHASSSSFPDSKKARLIRLWSVPSYQSVSGLQGLGLTRGQETGSIFLRNSLEHEMVGKFNMMFRSTFTSYRGGLASLLCSSLTWWIKWGRLTKWGGKGTMIGQK